MKIKYIIIAVSALLFAACSNEDIDSWSGKGYAWFDNPNVDVTFKMRTDIPIGGSTLVGIPFTVAATKENRDREVGVEIVRQPKDSRTKFELQKPVIFHANHLVDTLWVKVYNSEHLNTVHDTISFKIVPSADFDPGLNGKTTANLCLFNGYPRPKWWDKNAENHLGYFTQLKMEVYYAVFGSDKDPRGSSTDWWYNIGVTYAVQLLNDYVAEHDIYYPDDDPNAPGEQPVFDWGSY